MIDALTDLVGTDEVDKLDVVKKYDSLVKTPPPTPTPQSLSS